jgi:hypothetical protein
MVKVHDQHPDNSILNYALRTLLQHVSSKVYQNLFWDLAQHQFFYSRRSLLHIYKAVIDEHSDLPN